MKGFLTCFRLHGSTYDIKCKNFRQVSYFYQKTLGQIHEDHAAKFINQAYVLHQISQYLFKGFRTGFQCAYNRLKKFLGTEVTNSFR